MLPDDDLVFCEGCEQDYCEECYSFCRACDSTMCRGCLSTCPLCDEVVCEGCLSICTECDSRACAECFDEELKLCRVCKDDREDAGEEEGKEDEPRVETGQGPDVSPPAAEREPQGPEAKTCANCSVTVPEYDAFWCECCDQHYCGHCYGACSRCYTEGCLGCLSKCESCKGYFCGECFMECPECDARLCDECSGLPVFVCPICKREEETADEEESDEDGPAGGQEAGSATGQESISQPVSEAPAA